MQDCTCTRLCIKVVYRTKIYPRSKYMYSRDGDDSRSIAIYVLEPQGEKLHM